MNDKILNLDNKIKLKKTVENNIIYVIKNYAINIDQIKTKFIQYRKQYIMSILYNNIKILLIIEEIYNPLTMDKDRLLVPSKRFSKKCCQNYHMKYSAME